jgi:hypothetical protein
MDAMRAWILRIAASALIATMLALAAGPATAAAQRAAQPAVPIGDADGDGDIDLNDLVKRISDSKAMGVFTKLTLKKDIDALKRDLKAFHDGGSQHKLEKLHERYDVLVHKLMALLQEKDPGLAREVSQARTLLWSKLADPKEFRRL